MHAGVLGLVLLLLAGIADAAPCGKLCRDEVASCVAQAQAALPPTLTRKQRRRQTPKLRRRCRKQYVRPCRKHRTVCLPTTTTTSTTTTTTVPCVERARSAFGFWTEGDFLAADRFRIDVAVRECDHEIDLTITRLGGAPHVCPFFDATIIQAGRQMDIGSGASRALIVFEPGFDGCGTLRVETARARLFGFPFWFDVRAPFTLYWDGAHIDVP